MIRPCSRRAALSALPAASIALTALLRSAPARAVGPAPGATPAALPGGREAPLPAESGDPAEALHVLNRLGFGPAPGELQRVARLGIDGYIEEQLHPERLPLPAALQSALQALPVTQLSQRELIEQFRDLRRQAKDDPQDKALVRATLQRSTLEQGQARLLQAVGSPRQLEEVMVDFWFNHFNVYEGKGLDRALVENYEREAIRPHALGRFRDLLGATAHHPAMLFYLDNWLSVAPGFQGGRGKAKSAGLNENYARELMELHTLGVDGGYTQHDVTELARMLTGWTFDARAGDAPSVFVFRPARHDTGAKQWLGEMIPPGGGREEGEHALDVLARHPATARHIAFELAQKFVADAPPAPLVDHLAAHFRQTDGDLRAVLGMLFASAEFRAPAVRGVKFKTPYDYVISTLRVTALPVTDARPYLGALRQLGMPLYGCQTPDGYQNTQSAWLNPDAIARRVDFATRLAHRPGAPHAEALWATLGPQISAKSRADIARSDPRLQTAMLLGSPDFMRR